MNDTEVGARLKRLRQERGMSQIAFAESVNVSVGAYQGYERGEREIPSSMLLCLYDVYEIDPLWMIRGLSVGERAPISPAFDSQLLVQAGVAIENAIAKQSIQISATKRYHIVAVLFKSALRTGVVDSEMAPELVTIFHDAIGASLSSSPA